MKKIYFLLIVCLLLSFQLKADVIRIKAGTDTEAVNKQIKSLVPGDTLLFEGGTHYGTFDLKDIHGSHNRPIVFKGLGADLTVIDGGASLPGSELTNYAFSIKNSSWLQFEDFKIENAWVDVFRINESSYIALRNCNITGGKRVIYTTGRKSHHFLIEKCNWEQNERVWTHEGTYNWTELHHGIHQHYNGSIFQGRKIGGSFVIRDNYIKNIYNAFRLSTMGNTAGDTLACLNGEIYRNTIINSADNAFEPEVYSKNLHYYHNKMINGHAFMSITEVNGGPMYIYGNTGVSLPDCDDGWCIYKTSSGKIHMTKPLYIFNNSWHVDYNLLGRDGQPNWKNDYIKHFNNAYYFEKGDSAGIFYLGKDNEFDYDISNLPFPDLLTSRRNEKNAIISDPMFVNGTYGDFHLRENSPAKDSGREHGFITLTPYRGKIDRGAYDNGELVEGPIFQYVDPGSEVSHKDIPQITRYKILGKQLKLAFSSPVDPGKIKVSDFVLQAKGKEYVFNKVEGSANNYVLILTAKTMLPKEDISLIVYQWPMGINGQKATFWASEIPIIDRSDNNEKQIKADALLKTGKVADMVKNSTLFEFKPAVYTSNANVIRLSLDQYKINPGQKVVAKTYLKSDKVQIAIMGFSFRGDIRIYLNKKEIFFGSSDKLQFKEYTYGRFKVDNKITINLNKGNNELIIQCKGNMEDTEILLLPLDREGSADNTIKFSGNLNIEYANNWLIAFLPDSTDPLGEIQDWQLNAPQLIQKLVIAPDNLYQKDSYADWHYANGNTMLGILYYSQACGDMKYRDFVQAYAQNVESHKQYFKKQYEEETMIRIPFYRLFRKTMLDDTGGPVLPLAGLAFTENNKEYSVTLNEMLDYVMNGQQRLENGTFCRPEPVDNTVWGDDLFMSLPFLLRMATINNDKSLYDEAARQIIQFNEVLLDKSNGLYRHAWFNDKKELSVANWGRANGWVAWATSEALMLLPKNHPSYNKIKKIHTDHLSALVKYQEKDGFWHQILTISEDPASYKETSCTAMFSLAMARGVRGGWLPETFRQPALKGWNAVSSRIDDDGNVRGICKSTALGFDLQHYYDQRPTINDPRGLGSVLTLGSEIYKLIQ